MTAGDLAMLVGAIVGGYVGGQRGASKAIREHMRNEVASGVEAHERRCQLKHASLEDPILSPSGRWPLTDP